VTCLPDPQATGKCRTTSTHKALCVEAAMNAQQQQQQQQIVLGPMRAVVAAGNGFFVGTTSGGMHLGTTASSNAQMQINSSSNSSAADDSLLGMLSHSTQSANSIACLQMPTVQASSSSYSSGGITDLSISAADSTTVIGISSSTSDTSFMRILSPSHAVNKSAADSFAAASSAQPDRRARLVVIQTTTAATAALRVTVPTSVPLPLQLATPDLLACSGDGAWIVVGSHACSRLLCYSSTNTTSTTNAAATAMTAVLTLQLPESARPRGVLIVPTKERTDSSSSSSKQCSEWEVWVLAAWPASSTTTSVKAGSGYVLCSTQLLIFDLPTAAAVFDSTSNDQNTAQESATTTEAIGSSSTEVAQLLHAFEQRVNTRLDALCAVVEQQGRQLNAIEQRLQAQTNAL
jgi:hypothetical protein